MVSYRPAAVTAALVCGTAAAFSPAGRRPQFIFPARPARAPSGGGAGANCRTSRPTGAVLRVASREQTEISGGGSSSGGGKDVPPEIQRHMHLPLVPMPTKRPAGARGADSGGIPSTNDRNGASSANGHHGNAASNDIDRQHVPQHNQLTPSRPEASSSANGRAGAQILNDHLAAAPAAGSEYYSDDMTIGELALQQHGHEHHDHLVEDEKEGDSQNAFLGDDNEDEYDVIIGPGSTLSLGTSALTFPSTLLVQGTITGHVECTASRDNGGVAAPGSRVRVSSNGSIEGDVLSVETVEVCAEGSIVGDVRCKCLKVAEGGEIVGDVTCGSLFLEPGATVRGVIRCGEATADDATAKYPALEAAAEPLAVSETERNGVNAINGVNGGMGADTNVAPVDPADIYEIGHPVTNGYPVDAPEGNDYQIHNGQHSDSNGIVNGHDMSGHQTNGQHANGHQQANGHNGAQQQMNLPDYNANGQHIHVDFDHSLTHSSASTVDVPKVNGWGALPPVTATRSTSNSATSKVPNFQPQFPYDPSGSKHISIRNGLGMDIGEKGGDSTATSDRSSAASFDNGIFGYLGNAIPKSNGAVVEKKQPSTVPISHNSEPLPTTVTRDINVPRVLDKNGEISTQGTLDAIKEQYEKESEDPFYLDDFGNPLYRGANDDEMTTLRNNRELVDENRRLIEDYLRSKQEKIMEEDDGDDGEYAEQSAATRYFSDGDESHRRYSKKSSGGFKKRLSVKASVIDTNDEEDILPHFLKEDRRRRR